MLAGCAALLAIFSGCSKQPEQTGGARLPHPGADREYSVEWPPLNGGADRYIHLAIGPDIAQQCRVKSPHFQFDEAETRAQDFMGLQALAECLSTERLDKAGIQLVGRADPRGTEAYNLELGQKRAERIKALLIKEGIDAGRITISSRGEAGSVGAQPMYSYGYDRRVDVVLTGVVHAPQGGR
jgi:peptidoglycan-associated lipoprotein